MEQLHGLIRDIGLNINNYLRQSQLAVNLMYWIPVYGPELYKTYKGEMS
jgi:hypothetical protein